MIEKRLCGTLVTLGFFGKGAGDNFEEQETSRAAKQLCGRDSVVIFGQAQEQILLGVLCRVLSDNVGIFQDSLTGFIPRQLASSDWC